MKEKKHLFFDLDGTIVDSSPGIYASIAYSLEKMGREPLSPEVLRTFIGPPLLDSYLNLGMTAKEANEGVAFYREHYRQGALFQATVYEGLPELLAHLSEENQLYIATSKPEVFAKEMLAKFALADHFQGIYGADLAGERDSKAKVLAYALEGAGNVAKNLSWMIGDRKHDMTGAYANQLPGIGVLWGFGDRKELESAGASHCVATPGELLAYCEQI